MRIVIDSNRMQSEELRSFLSLSTNNRAVLTDYAAMEAFKGNTLVSIQASWSVLRDFPKQMVILKGTRAAAKVDPQIAGFTNRFIDRTQTREVSNFSKVLERAARGEVLAQQRLILRGQWADDHLNGMLKKSGDMHLSISEFCAQFTDAELQRFRRQVPWKDETEKKFFDLVYHLTWQSFQSHPDKIRFPRGHHLLNHFLYRHTLAYCVYIIQLVMNGTVERKASLVRNDAVDVIFATLATYFNGLMSGDDHAEKIHHVTRFLLKQRGARVPEDYMRTYAGQIKRQMQPEEPSDLTSPLEMPLDKEPLK